MRVAERTGSDHGGATKVVGKGDYSLEERDTGEKRGGERGDRRGGLRSEDHGRENEGGEGDGIDSGLKSSIS
jgi:hypothetical protein